MSKVRHYTVWVFIGTLLLALSACDTGNSTSIQSASQPDAMRKGMVSQREGSFEQIESGRKIFQKRCSGCHGNKAQGNANWRQRGADGRWPAPPLNGTGHAWHHPQKVLHNVIKNGSPNGQGNMPAWGGVLSDKEIDAAIVWFQSLWPEKIYASWLKGVHKHGG